MDQSKASGKNRYRIIGPYHKLIKLESIKMVKELKHGNMNMKIRKQVVENMMINIQRMVDGLNQVTIFQIILISLIVVNIKITKELINGILITDFLVFIHLNRLVVDHTTCKGLRMANGQIQLIISIVIKQQRLFIIIQLKISYIQWRILNYRKVGRWDTYFRIEGLFQREFSLIGGGFNEYGSIKNGRWIEQSDNFYKQLNCLLFQLYSYQNGKKIKSWVTKYKQKDQLEQIGGGYYDVKGSKQGYWIELSDDFRQDRIAKSLVILSINKEEKQINGISFLGSLINLNKCDFYNEQGFKIGSWVEINKFSSNLGQVLYQGEYFFGKKTGKWNSYWKNNINLEKLGGGLYDDNGLKKRIWIELANDFNQQLIYIYNINIRDKQVSYQGEYNCGQKVGVWDTYFRFSERFKEISCGFYDQEGIENGIQIELDEDFKMNQNCQNEQQQQLQINHSLGTIQRRQKDLKMDRIKERKMEY
ncbi:unnamed protein product [Paramecium pentaurelia]|uniref:Uncharacterized protein n=1 Tax=Paramecium pentaurelia TaxID=43138 RepID=A0A8S1YIG5_9CILI|nr:unnamed protein product [Paramecium pentaurelia]